VRGRFWRAVDARFRARAIEGSVSAGRYNAPDVPALYTSASEAGVAAAMRAHARPGASERVLVEMHVEADGIFDLRDDAALRALGVDPGAAAAPWQDVAAAGGRPPSWGVADRIRGHGAAGLIDPSRAAPGLWHLVLWRWNAPGAPRVRLVTV
jgi:RES domain-containing protein